MDQKLLSTIITKLKQSGQTVSTAESCTGGLLATYLTEIPGSSEVYQGGISCYSNYAKAKLLQVPSELIEAYGAVSKEVAEVMATNIKGLLASDYGLSLTGIAGPSGGSKEKPVGTVWCGLASRRGLETFMLQLSGDRGKIRQGAAELALMKLLEKL